MKDFKGKMLCLDRADINTDEIIPARYLTEISKSALKPHLLEDLVLEGFNPETDLKDVRVIVSRGNFGCGSSREHAPWALETNGINVVIAPSFARIFRQNMFNCGMMAIELPDEKVQTLFELGAGKETQLCVNVENDTLIVTDDSGKELTLEFSISEFDKNLVKTGGWVEFADKNY